ncbi:MAG TPA: hypothetical protein VF236_08975 [Gaiellaceae bacterium]
MNQRAITVPSLRLPHLRLGALVAIGLAAFLVGWLAMNRGDDAPPAPGTGASAASESELKAFAESASHPVYWAGPKDGYTYELTQTTNGFVYVRYLPEGTEVGDPRSRFLTIGTYPRAGAFAELKRAAKAEGALSLKLERGGMAVFSEARPTSVYLGYPDARYQVEVYHPSSDEARRLALSGQVVPVR